MFNIPKYEPKLPTFTFDYNISPPSFSFDFHIQTKQNKKPIKPTVKQTKKFYQHKHKIIPTILQVTDPHEVIHGERAVQRYIPKRLRRHTTDIDIFSHTPKEDAVEAERKLDKKFGGDVFFTEPGMHEGTWRVKSHTTGNAYADYTKPETGIMPPHQRIGRFNYVTESYIKKHNKKILRDPDASYRHAKDKDTLNRLKIG